MSTDVASETAELLAVRAACDDRQVRTEALARLYELYVDRTYRLAMARLRDHHMAEDLAQDVWAAMPRKIQSFKDQGAGSFSRWLNQVVVNAVVDLVRKERRRFPVLTEDMLELDQASTDPGQEVLYERKAAARAVRDAMQDLGEAQRRCLLMRFFLEMSVTEVAREMGMKENAVKQLQLRGTRSLARRLGDVVERVTPQVSEPLVVDTTPPRQRASRDDEKGVET